MTPGTWHHLVAVYASDTLRVIYLDGVNVEVNTDNVSTAALDFAYFGNYLNSTFVDIAEVSAVMTEVSAEQAAALARGQPIWPMPLAEYAITFHDCIRQLNRPGLGPIFSSAGSPTVIDHPRIISSNGGVSAVMPLRFGGPWQVEQTESHPLSTEIGQYAMSGVVANNSILLGEVTS